MMFGFWKRRKDLTPYTTYQNVMGQARKPVFYTLLGVPDTIEGRFDLLIAHSILVLRRMKSIEGERTQEAADRAQSFADVLFKDLDRAMRETGVSDVSVPKKMNKLASAFFGRGKAFGAALDARDHDALVAAIHRNTTGGLMEGEAAAPPATLDGQALALYLQRAEDMLAALPPDEVLSGRLTWPDPSAFTLATARAE